jgi:hypothetical protein
MKLKLLTLLLTIGIGLSALGSDVSAAEEKLTAGAEKAMSKEEAEDYLKTQLFDLKTVACAVLDKDPGFLPSCCKTFCETDDTNISDIGKCISSISAYTQNQTMCNGNPTICSLFKSALSGAKQACTATPSPCTGRGTFCMGSITTTCGNICCNLGMGDNIKGCLGSKACTPYNQKDCLTPTCTPACKAPQTCVNGKCVAPSGGCTPACKAPQTCVNGKCVTPPPAGCKPACKAPQTCVNGQCVTPANKCGTGPACTNGNACSKAGKCNCGGGPACTGAKNCVSNKCK